MVVNKTKGGRTTSKLFDVGKQFPDNGSIERLAKYARMKKIFDGKIAEVYDRASALLKNSPHAPQLEKLYIAVNLMEVLLTKPADMLVGDGILFESGLDDESAEQQALNRIVEENDLQTLIHELVISAGIRGDAWVKTYYANRDDASAVIAEGLEVPPGLLDPEPVIEAIPADMVFPELAKGSFKRFKAVNICSIEHVKQPTFFDKEKEITYLNVERHLPGYIIYERYRLSDKGVDNTFDYPIPLYNIEERVATGREDSDVVYTGVPNILVEHIPYKSVDDDWQGIGGIEKLESVLAAINDRLVQIDYILWKHSDPTAYGPDIDGDGESVRFGGKYIPVGKEDATPGYMVWNSQLEGAFKELDYLLSIVFQMSETPQWLFGTTITQDKGGTGTSHSDGRAIQMRLMPILSKVARIKLHVDKAIRNIIYLAQRLEVYANEGVEGFKRYEPQYPKIVWYDPLPKDSKEEAEIMNIRTGGKATIDVQSAVKRLDRLDDIQAREIIKRIGEDEQAVSGFVDGSIFNNEPQTTPPEGEGDS